VTASARGAAESRADGPPHCGPDPFIVCFFGTPGGSCSDAGQPGMSSEDGQWKLGGRHIGHHRGSVPGRAEAPEQEHGEIGSERATSVRQGLVGTTSMSTLGSTILLSIQGEHR